MCVCVFVCDYCIYSGTSGVRTSKFIGIGLRKSVTNKISNKIGKFPSRPSMVYIIHLQNMSVLSILLQNCRAESP